MIQFKNPEYFLLFAVLPFLYVWLMKRRKSSLSVSFVSELKKIGTGRASRIQQHLNLLRIIAFTLLVVALTRPQTVTSEREFEASGIDIVLALDISGSMLAEDFKPINRITVAKQEAKRFIQSRQSDRIGLVVFSAKSYTQCPLTLDYDVLMKLIDDIEVGMIKDGTAIGLGIANAVNRLRETDGKSKIIILLTDGNNNAGNIDPITAAELARSFGIRIYTIGIGTAGMVPFPIEDPIFGKRYVQAQVDIDEGILKRISDITGGLYFSARDAASLAKVYKRINELEKSVFKVKEYTSFSELFHGLLLTGLMLLMLEMLFRNTLFIKIP